MEICRWLCYIFIKCVLIQSLSAKTVSLNELIAAASQDNQVAEKPPLKYPGLGRKRTSLNEIDTVQSEENQVPKYSSTRKSTALPQPSSLFKRLASHSKIRKFKTDNSFLGDSIISPLRYRKTYLIKSPLKPKKLKLALLSRHKRRNQSIKREIIGNENLKQKYIPLLKSLSLLVDNLLSSDDASDSFEIKRRKYKRNRFYSEEQLEAPCNCSSNPSSGITKSRAQKKTTTPSPSFSSEISSDTEDFSFDKNYDYSTFRPYKNIPILLPRNTFGSRRNYNGPSKRSSATYHGDIEGYLTGNHGDHEYNAGHGKDDSSAEGHENDPDSVTRNDASGLGHRRRDGKRINTRNSKNRKTTVTYSSSKNKNTDDSIGQNQFEVRGNETESEKSIREPGRRLRGLISEDKITHDARLRELIQPEEVREESFLSATVDSTGHQRITDENGPIPTEDEKIRTRNETVTLINKNSRNPGTNSKGTEKKSPVLLIFDGYSVTRDINGANKVSGKTIHIRS